MVEFTVRVLIMLVFAGWMTYMELPPDSGGSFLPNFFLIAVGSLAVALMSNKNDPQEDAWK